MKHESEQDMEKYLGEFQPRAVRPLQVDRIVERGTSRFDWQRLAAAAVLLVALGTSLRLALRNPTQVQDAARQEAPGQVARRGLNRLQLTRLALSDTEKFDEVLTQQSRESLPDLRGENRALRVLAQE